MDNTYGNKWMCLIVSVLLCLHLCTDLSLLGGSQAFVWDLGESQWEVHRCVPVYADTVSVQPHRCSEPIVVLQTYRDPAEPFHGWKMPKEEVRRGTPEQDQQGPVWIKTLQANMEHISLKNRYFHSKNQKSDHRFDWKRKEKHKSRYTSMKKHPEQKQLIFSWSWIS